MLHMFITQSSMLKLLASTHLGTIIHLRPRNFIHLVKFGNSWGQKVYFCLDLKSAKNLIPAGTSLMKSQLCFMPNTYAATKSCNVISHLTCSNLTRLLTIVTAPKTSYSSIASPACAAALSLGCNRSRRMISVCFVKAGLLWRVDFAYTFDTIRFRLECSVRHSIANIGSTP